MPDHLRRYITRGGRGLGRQNPVLIDSYLSGAVEVDVDALV